MQYTITEDSEFLRVRLWDRDVDRPPSEVCAAVIHEADGRGRKRILVELDQKVALSPTSQHALVTRLPALGLTPAHRIALVHSRVEMQEANEYINLVARNHDISVRSFTGLEAAKAWLRGESEA